MDANGLDLQFLESAPDSGRLPRVLVEWIESLGLPQDRRLIPISHKWTFEFSYLTAWLGQRLFESLFRFMRGDAMTLALSLNDRMELLGHKRPFERVSLHDLCQKLEVVNDHPHDALSDAVAETEVYRRLLLWYEMEAAFAWIGAIANWIGRFVPRFIMVRAPTRSKVPTRQDAHRLAAGLRIYWPLVTEAGVIPCDPPDA